VTEHWSRLAREVVEPWRYSKAFWIWSWATSSRWLYLSRGVGPDGLQGSIATSAIL